MSKLTLAEFKERRAAERAEDAAHFRAHWKWILLEAICDIGFGTLLGFLLGLVIAVELIVRELR
jgi:hypothetical protein